MAITIANISPSLGSSIESSDFVSFELHVPTGGGDFFRQVVISVAYPGLGLEELAYSQDASLVSSFAFISAFIGSGIVRTLPVGEEVLTVTLRRSPVWPDSINVRVFAVSDQAEFFDGILNFLVSDPPATEFTTPSNNLVPFIQGATNECSAGVSQDYFLRLLDRLFPESYLRPMKKMANGGYEHFQSAAKVGERVSIAIDRFECNNFVLSSHVGAYATGTIEFYRASAGVLPTYKLFRGSIVGTASGRKFQTTEDVDITAGNLGPFTCPIQSVAKGYQYNVTGVSVSPRGEVTPGEIDTIYSLKMDVPQFDLELKARNIAPTSGGVFPGLEAIGNDLGLPRKDNEPEDVYRLRIIETPDTVSLGAFKRAIARVFGPTGLATPIVREVGTPDNGGDDGLPGFFFDAGSSSDSPQNPQNNYAFDMDPTARPLDTWKLLLDYDHFRASVLIGLPKLSLGEFGMCFDTASTDPFPIANAFDTTANDASRAAYDGYETIGAAYNKAIYDLLNDKRAGGVLLDFYQL